jgi:hypothetical protein
VALSDDQKAMLRLLAQREQGYADIASLTGGSVDDVRARVKEAIAGLDEGLSQDQAAVLRLLAQREEGYADIGALTGLGVDDVRAKVKDALAGLDEGGEKPKAAAKAPPPPAEPKPTPPPPPPPEPPAAPAPKPAAKTRAPKPAAKASRTAPKIGLPEDKGALRALIAGAAVVVIIVLLLVTGVLGGDDSGSSDSTTATTGGESALGEESGSTPTVNGKEATEAILKAVDGSDATGQALFGRTGQKVVLLLGAKGLRQAPEGQSYTVSLVRSESQRLPLIATTATKSGIISGRFEIAPQVLGLLAGGFDTMELSLVPDDELRVALEQARKSKKAPDYGGTTVLEGPVTGPIVEAGEEKD